MAVATARIPATHTTNVPAPISSFDCSPAAVAAAVVLSPVSGTRVVKSFLPLSANSIPVSSLKARRTHPAPHALLPVKLLQRRFRPLFQPRRLLLHPAMPQHVRVRDLCSQIQRAVLPGRFLKVRKRLLHVALGFLIVTQPFVRLSSYQIGPT